MERVLTLAIITNDHFRAEATEQIANDLGWHLHPCVGHAQPLEWLRRQRVDLALVDLDVPDAIGLLGELSSHIPHLPLLALTTPQHLVQLQDALLAGAASFVAYPVESGQFTATIMRTVQSSQTQNSRHHRGQIVAVVGLRGGVGRTTLAVNLAVALRKRSTREVILLEAHHGLGDIALLLNLLPRHTVASLIQESNLDLDVIQGHLQTHSSGIQILSAPSDLSQLVELPMETWRSILELLGNLAPYVIVDTAAVADPVLSEVLTLADEIVVVTGPDLAGLRSAMMLLQTLDEEENVQGRVHVVLNRAGVRGGVSVQASSEQIGERIVATIPDDPGLVTYALNRGVPLMVSHANSVVGREIDGLLDTIFDLQQTDEKRRTLFRHLFTRHRRTAVATN